MIITKEEALKISRDIFNKWNNLLKTNDPRKVSELYTENNMFLPTLSGEFEFGREGDIEYFNYFLQKKPVGRIVEDDVRVGERFIVHAGMYTFEVDSADGGREDVEARFTFVYTQNELGEWRIVHHHSSLKPNV